MEIETPKTASQNPAEEWMTLAQASRLLGRHPTAVQRMALIGDIKIRLGDRIRYSRSDAMRYASAS